MKLLLSCCLFFLSAALQAQPAHPGLLAQGDGERWEQRQGDFPRLGREERLERREARRQWLDSRQAERPGAHSDFSPPGGEERHRLSPEERQRLRRDVHEAGREFYPREDRPFRGEPPLGQRPFRRP